MRKWRIYLDTSVINFLYADDAQAYRAITVEFFDQRLEQFEVFISDVVLFEIGKTEDHEKKAVLFEAIRKYNLKTMLIHENKMAEITSLADRYISAGIIPTRKRQDALHIAICTVFEFDVLLSWNFRHLANFQKQVQINALNETSGYLKKLYLLTPLEVMDENND